MDTREQLEQIRAEAAASIESAASLQELDAVRVKYLGKKGELTAVLKTMGKLSPEERPLVGQMANEVRELIAADLEKRNDLLKAAQQEMKLATSIPSPSSSTKSRRSSSAWALKSSAVPKSNGTTTTSRR